MFRKLTALAAAAGLAGIGFVAAPSAFAQSGPCPAGNPNANATCDEPATGVSANVTIPTSLTLTLAGTSFNIAAAAGSKSYTTGGNYDDNADWSAVTSGQPGDGFVTQATVSTNDGAGYYVTEALANNTFQSGAATIPDTDFDATTYPANAPTLGTGGEAAGLTAFNGTGALAGNVASTTKPSQGGGDLYNFGWEMDLTSDSGQAGGTYTNTIDFTGWAN